MVRNLAIFTLIVLFIVSSASAEIVRIMPGSDSISSTQIHDATMGANNSVIFATDNGLSIYFCDQGGWKIMHPDYSNSELSVQNNFILAVEPDKTGNGWFGYPSALQIYDGTTFTTVNDPNILYKNSINDLQLRGNEMWVAVGKGGLVMFENDSYEWFQPFRESGLDAYKITSLAVDPSGNRLIAVSYNYGAWALEESGGTYSFAQIPVPEDVKLLQGVVSNPYGGVYIFSTENIYSYRDGVVRHVLSADTIDKWNVTQITDATVSKEGVLIVGTDDGIAGYLDGDMVLRLKNRDGLGGYNVRFLFTDSDGRIWYSVRDNAGYIYPISNHIKSGVTLPAPPTTKATATETPVPTEELLTGPVETGTTDYTDYVPTDLPEEDGGILGAITGFFGSLWDTLMSPMQDVI